MTLHVLDTDILSLYREYDPVVSRRVDASPFAEIAITVITIEEQLSGWYTYVRKATRPDDLARGYQELADSIPFLANWKILPYPEPAIARYQYLAKLKLKVRKMDLRIAAIVLENNATLVTRNLRDFRRVPNLVAEDWSV
jgi:tRNA(fMet)-specific endonuclease VapC